MLAKAAEIDEMTYAFESRKASVELLARRDTMIWIRGRNHRLGNQLDTFIIFIDVAE